MRGLGVLQGRLNTILQDLTPKFTINSEAYKDRTDCRRRWFDLDDSGLQHTLASSGPRLIHFVASMTQAASGVASLPLQGIDRGPLLEASRMTPNGLLAWKITVRAQYWVRSC